jgi:hypothetical protein
MSGSNEEAVPRYVVYNYVTNRAIRSETAPDYGDPNSAVQAQVSNAYTGGMAGTSLSAASATPNTTPSTLAGPAADAIATANEADLPPEQIAQITASLGGLGQIGGIPGMLNSMTSHANTILAAPTKILGAINEVFKPEEEGSPDRCNKLGGFIGSLQGIYNSTLGAITTGLNAFTNLLVAVPTAIIGAFTAATTALISAISSGVSGLINLAIKGLDTATGGFFTALGAAGTSLVKSIAGGVSLVASAIQGEIKNVADALGKILTSPFRLMVPNVNPCIKKILADANPASAVSPSTPEAAEQTFPPVPDINPEPLTENQLILRKGLKYWETVRTTGDGNFIFERTGF